MRIFAPLMLTSLAALTACGTPQQRCIGAVTRDMRVVDRLIAESEANIARGYALERTVKTRMEWVECGIPAPTPENPDPAPRLCLEDVPYETRQPVAIDLNAEAAKLASLREKRAQQAEAVAPQIAACQEAYPE
jgi:hypothetical protein